MSNKIWRIIHVNNFLLNEIFVKKAPPTSKRKTIFVKIKYAVWKSHLTPMTFHL